MKPFTRTELKGLIVIFLILAAITIPNFIVSIRRARDQIRRDDMGALQAGLMEYFSDFGEFPISSPDGKIMGCKAPGAEVQIDSKGRLIVDLTPCTWGQDPLVDLTPGGGKKYLNPIPQDPDGSKGVSYAYFSDGQRFQIFTSFEILTQAEVDPKIISRNISCGSKICNVGRSYGCPVSKTIEQCAEEAKSK